jgi:hypothetical protein
MTNVSIESLETGKGGDTGGIESYSKLETRDRIVEVITAAVLASEAVLMP